jgi:hypothetical protein
MSNTPELDRIPTNARSKALRACLLCSIVQAPQEFRRTGCPNCEEVMQVRYYHHIPQKNQMAYYYPTVEGQHRTHHILYNDLF